MRLAGYLASKNLQERWSLSEGRRIMLQIFGQIVMVGLVIGVVGTIWIVILDRY
jgi:hypothetical protein